MIDTYGKPDGIPSNRLVWYDNGPWKRSVLRPDGTSHAFPDHHIDYVVQVIDDHVPPARADEVITFDGSVTIRRTCGALSAECHGEPANFLAINLVHDMLEGEKTVEESRDVYAAIYARKEVGHRPTTSKRSASSSRRTTRPTRTNPSSPKSTRRRPQRTSTARSVLGARRGCDAAAARCVAAADGSPGTAVAGRPRF